MTNRALVAQIKEYPVSLRDRILATDDTPTETLTVPEWDCDLLIKGMSGADRAGLLERAVNPDGGVSFSKFYPEVVIATAHDPATGERLFDEADRDLLMSKSGAALDRVATIGLKLSGMTDEATKAAGKDS